MGDGSDVVWFKAPGLEVLGVSDDGVEVTIAVETTATVVGCPGRGSRARAKDRRWVTLRDATLPDRAVRRRWRKRIWSCPESACKKLCGKPSRGQPAGGRPATAAAHAAQAPPSGRRSGRWGSGGEASRGFGSR